MIVRLVLVMTVMEVTMTVGIFHQHAATAQLLSSADSFPG